MKSWRKKTNFFADDFYAYLGFDHYTCWVPLAPVSIEDVVFIGKRQPIDSEQEKVRDKIPVWDEKLAAALAAKEEKQQEQQAKEEAEETLRATHAAALAPEDQKVFNEHKTMLDTSPPENLMTQASLERMGFKDALLKKVLPGLPFREVPNPNNPDWGNWKVYLPTMVQHAIDTAGNEQSEPLASAAKNAKHRLLRPPARKDREKGLSDDVNVKK